MSWQKVKVLQTKCTKVTSPKIKRLKDSCFSFSFLFLRMSRSPKKKTQFLRLRPSPRGRGGQLQQLLALLRGAQRHPQRARWRGSKVRGSERGRRLTCAMAWIFELSLFGEIPGLNPVLNPKKCNTCCRGKKSHVGVPPFASTSRGTFHFHS